MPHFVYMLEEKKTAGKLPSWKDSMVTSRENHKESTKKAIRNNS